MDSYAARPLCNQRPLRWWKWIGLSVETEVGVTRGLMEYAWWGDRLRTTNHRSSPTRLR